MRLDPVRWIFVITGGTPVIDVKKQEAYIWCPNSALCFHAGSVRDGAACVESHRLSGLALSTLSATSCWCVCNEGFLEYEHGSCTSDLQLLYRRNHYLFLRY